MITVHLLIKIILRQKIIYVGGENTDTGWPNGLLAVNASRSN
jgi:hypothetical protein